jgi:8-oxo-dGTP pyrophosphatase MutT (NUDIX family)
MAGNRHSGNPRDAIPWPNLKWSRIVDLNPWKVLREEVKFSCPYFDVRQDLVSHTGQHPRHYNSIRMRNFGAVVLPVDQHGLVSFIGQYRYVVGRYTWELPAGGGPVGTNPQDAAQRELKEETGYCANQWLKLLEGDVKPGSSDAKVAGYIAWDLEEGNPQPDAEESLTLRKVPFSEAVELALCGEVVHLSSIALLLAAKVRASQGSLPSDLCRLLQ